jgi:hypothetical protein
MVVADRYFARASEGEPAPPVMTRLYGVKPVPVIVTVSGCEPAAAVLGEIEATTGAASAASPATG